MFKKIVFAFIISFFAFTSAYSATRTWDGGGANDYWDTDANWSDDSKPVSGDTAVFDNTSDDPCVIREAINMGNVTINMNSGYDGTLTQGYTVTCGAITCSSGTWSGSANLNCSGLTVSGGTVTLGGTDTITGSLAQSSGSLTLSSGTTNITVDLSGTFTHSNGTVVLSKLNGNQTINTGSNFYNLTIDNNGTRTITLSQDCNVTNKLLFNQTAAGTTTVNSNKFVLTKDFQNTGENIFKGSSLLYFTGTAAQTFTGNAQTATYYLGLNLEIDKSSGTITFNGTQQSFKNCYWKLTRGTVSASSFKLYPYCDTNTEINMDGVTWGGLILKGNSTRAVKLTTDVIVSGDVETTGVGDPQLDAQTSEKTISFTGDLKLVQDILNSGAERTKLIANGTGTQNLTFSSGSLLTCDLEINKASGTFYFGTSIDNRFKDMTLTHTLGTVDPQTSMAKFSGTCTINASGMNFYNVNFEDIGSTITLSSDINITGTLSTDFTSGTYTVNNNDINLLGTSSFTQNSVTWTGTSTLNFSGTGSQTWTGTDSIYANELSVVINKSSGTLALSGIIPYKTGTLTYTAGTVNPGTSTFKILGNCTINTNGMSFYNFTTDTGGTCTVSSALDVNNNLTIGASTTLSVGTNQINCGANFANSGTFTHGNNAVVFDTSANTSVISGANTFYDLTCITPSKSIQVTAGTTQTITHTLNLDGQNTGTKITLNRNGGSGSDRFTFDVTGSAQTCQYLDVTNSNASTNNITATKSKNSGNTDTLEEEPHWIIQGEGQII